MQTLWSELHLDTLRRCAMASNSELNLITDVEHIALAAKLL